MSSVRDGVGAKALGKAEALGLGTDETKEHEGEGRDSEEPVVTLRALEKAARDPIPFRRHTVRSSRLTGVVLVPTLLAALSALACSGTSRQSPGKRLLDTTNELQSLILEARESALTTGYPVAVLVYPNFISDSQRRGRIIIYQDACRNFITRAWVCGVSYATFDPCLRPCREAPEQGPQDHGSAARRRRQASGRGGRRGRLASSVLAHEGRCRLLFLRHHWRFCAVRFRWPLILLQSQRRRGQRTTSINGWREPEPGV